MWRSSEPMPLARRLRAFRLAEAVGEVEADRAAHPFPLAGESSIAEAAIPPARRSRRSRVAASARTAKMATIEAAQHSWRDIALNLQPETIALRRAIHQEPELGLDLPQTKAKLLEALAPLGPRFARERDHRGIRRLARHRPARSLRLLRGDMDALPMSEATDLPFKSQAQGRMHACGHDGHSAMVMSAAKALTASATGCGGRSCSCSSRARKDGTAPAT